MFVSFIRLKFKTWKNMKRWIIFIAMVSALVLTLVLWKGGLLKNGGEQQEQNVTVKQEFLKSPEINFFTVRTENRAEVIPLEGRIRANNRLEIFPEVQGTVIGLEKPFREGAIFDKGEVLLQLNSEEIRLQLNASRSGFKALIASLLPDIKLDYPDKYIAVEDWFNQLHPEEVLSEIPDIEHLQFSRFLSSRGVYERYFNIKSSEERLKKFTIKAPFSGILSVTNTEPGQSVGPQNHLGTFVDPTRFVLTATIRQNQARRIMPGAELKVTNREGLMEWNAIVKRVNPSVNPKTQMVEVYLDVSGDGLREGMYLQGIILPEGDSKLARIPKSALLRTGHVYINSDGVIRLVPVEIKDVERESVWVKGLSDGDEIIQNTNRAIAGLIMPEVRRP
jgi:membrane fusion protein, multidrug efflux system